MGNFEKNAKKREKWYRIFWEVVQIPQKRTKNQKNAENTQKLNFKCKI